MHYDGNDIVLPKENQVLKTADHPDLSNQIGHDIITADGTTLLGADNKFVNSSGNQFSARDKVGLSIKSIVNKVSKIVKKA